jgi:hypothetical protein
VSLSRKATSVIEFRIAKFEKPSAGNVSRLKGPERKIGATVTGDFLLHGRKSKKSAVVEVTFKYDGGELRSAHVKTVEPFAVGLAEHDVHPREAFGKLAQRTLETLAPKVAKDARVSIDFTAEAKLRASRVCHANPARLAASLSTRQLAAATVERCSCVGALPQQAHEQ